MSNKLFLTLAATTWITSGCASITGTESQNVSVQALEQGRGEVIGAACELTNDKGKWYVTTPGSATIHRSNDDMQVVCSKAGLEPGRATVVSGIKGSMYGNILFGGGLGAIVDHNKGTAYEYPAFVQILMGAFSKIEPPKKPAPSAQEPAADSATIASSTQATGNTPMLDEKLKELKRLYDSGLIDHEVYLERQRELLAARP